MCVSCIAGTDLMLLAHYAEEETEFQPMPVEEAG